MTEMQSSRDLVLKSAVVAELTRTEGVNATLIGVGVTDGAVTLSGEVGSHPEKRLVEEALQRVSGVSALAEEITVRTELGVVTDTDIAREAGRAIREAVDIASNAVSASVTDQVVTLEGTVPWPYQRGFAERSIRRVKGVRGVQNNIRVKGAVSTGNLKGSIEDALVAHAVVDAQRCTITHDGSGAVTITGSVGTWVERSEVERLALAAPGVTAVHNHVKVVD